MDLKELRKEMMKEILYVDMYFAFEIYTYSTESFLA